jgi:hypothetical protein
VSYTKKQEREVLRLRQEQLPYAQIGRLVGVSTGTAHGICKEYGLVDQRSKSEPEPLVEVPVGTETLAGMVWCEYHPAPKTKTRFMEELCDKCEKLDPCRAAVRMGRPIACERFLQSEVLGV